MAKRAQDRHATAGQFGAAILAAAAPTAPPARKRVARHAPAPPAPSPSRDLLVTALTEPFNIVVLALLLIAGALLGALPLMVPLALLVYAAGVLRSYKDPATAARARARHDD
jgi:hypothetical protein